MIPKGFQCFCVCIVFLLLFGLSVSQNEEVIPTEAPEALSDVICKTCNCTDGIINCSNRDIKLPFEPQDWRGVKAFNPITLDLSQNPLSKITRISYLPIQTLNLTNCEIVTLENGSFMYLVDLVTLDLSMNKITTDKLSRRVFAGPLSLDTSSHSFEKIRYLSLAYNDIHSLPQDVFVFMTELSTLDLSGNPLAFLDQVTMAAITDLVYLKELSLSSCELETLPEGLFRRQRRLRRLDLSDNRFTTVPAVLSEATNLVYLNFGKNPIQTLEADNAIKNLTKLQDLRLCRNSKLQNISAGALAGLSDLVTLHVCYNPRLTIIDPDFLTYIDDHEIEVWPTITELNLNNNNLSQIDSTFLHRWDQLTVVDVTNNPYTCDCKNQWMVDVLVPLIATLGREELAVNMICKKPQEMRGLSFAQLHNSSKVLVCPESEGIVDLPVVSNLAIILGIMIGIFVTFPLVLIIVLLWRKGYFARCRSKRDLDDDDEETDAFELSLSSCELETLPEGLFRRQRRLRRLDLSDNRFTTVPAVLSEATNLVYLNFGKNPIQTLEADNAIKNLTKLQDLRLCRNSKLQNISAGALAGLSDLVTLHVCYNPRLTIIDPDFLTYIDDHEIEVWPTITELNLNNNNLSQIDSTFLHRWDQLTVVDVTNNPYTCDCKNQWMVDVLVPLIATLGREELAVNMICKKPQEMRGLSFAQLHNSSKVLVCPESEGIVDLPVVSNLAIILGIMIGIFVTFPLVLIIVLLWRKGYFARCRSKRDLDDDDEETDAF